MHPSVIPPSPRTMMSYPMFQSPLSFPQFDYHHLMFPFQNPFTIQGSPGGLQYAFAGIPFQTSTEFVNESQKSAKTSTQSSRSAKSNFSIESILSSKDYKKESSSPENSSKCRKLSSNSSHRRHERLKTLPYSRPAQHTRQFPQSPQSESAVLMTTLEDSDEKYGKIGWKSGRCKRIRTIFTPEQLERLESEFDRQQYMVGTERYYLASELNLTEAQVKVWFQNRRIKWRKQTLEDQHAQLAASHVYHNVGSESDEESATEFSQNKDSISDSQENIPAE